MRDLACRSASRLITTTRSIYSYANALSADGSVVAGHSYVASVSADGSVVVGEDYSGGQGFYWSESAGLQSIADWAGVEDSGFTQLYPRTVSANGQVVAGYGQNVETSEWQPWIARAGGIINPGEWLHSVSGTRQTFQSGQYLSNLALNGAHHRPLASYAGSAGDGSCVWANGDWGRHGSGRDARVALAEVGVCGQSGNLLAGLSLGLSAQHQNLPLDGEQDLDGRWDADIDRSYRNGATLDSSSGSTDVEASTLRLRADWLRAGLDIDHRVSEAGLLSLSLHGASEGQDASSSVAVKYLHRF